MGSRSVPASRFWKELTTILPEIADSEYVAVDFEMTGIEPRRAPKIDRPTIHQIYERAKQATETFNVVQFGITCIRFDPVVNDLIHLRSYNFNVSPLFDHGVSGVDTIARTLDRTLTLSYKTLMFLKRNCIRIEDAYDGGIQYLGRHEENEIYSELFEPAQRETIDIETQQPETQMFYRDTIQRIEALDRDPRVTYVNIVNPNGPLTGFQRRLVYQIVDIMFDGKYEATLQGNFFLQITERDKALEEKERLKKRNTMKKALAFQRGLRYIVEALVGGDFAKDVWRFYSAGPGMIEPDREKVLQESELKLKSRRPALIGHNMLHDLCFLHATFFGPLPDTVDKFGAMIYRLFPCILDTKHILKVGHNEMMPARALEDIYVDFENMAVPFTIDGQPVAAPSGQHLAREYHQAGHDSYKTSVVFLKEIWNLLQQDGNFRKGNGLYAHFWLQGMNPMIRALANQVRLGNAGTITTGPAVF